MVAGEFQSTLPVWGATPELWVAGARERNFNPRSPCGERHYPLQIVQSPVLFQSTLPVWGATAKLHKYFLKFYRI